MAAHKMCLLQLNEDILAEIAPYLAAADMANLSITCRHFGAGDEASLPLVQEAALRVVRNEQSELEKAALVRYPGESSIAVYHQLLELRAPLIFDVLVAGGSMEYEDGIKSRVIASYRSWEQMPKSAISTHIMRGGKHYAEFSRAQGDLAWAGLMRPISSPTHIGLGKLNNFHPASHLPKVVKQAFRQGRNERRWGTSNTDCCMYAFDSAQCICSNWVTGNRIDVDWEGQERFERLNREHTRTGVGCPSYAGVLGLLLDLGAGTLTAYKGGRRLGVMREGLAGEYCWVATISGVGAMSINRSPIPPIPDDA